MLYCLNKSVCFKIIAKSIFLWYNIYIQSFLYGLTEKELKDMET